MPRKSVRKSVRKSLRRPRKSVRKSVRKSLRRSRKSVRKSSRKTLKRLKNDEKLKAYFRKKLKSYNGDYMLLNGWIHPISGKQARVSSKERRLFEEVKKEFGVKGKKRCNVKKSPTNKREDLIKEIKAYVKCWEKKTGRNQDLSNERLKNESLSQIKKHLKFYRENNDL